MHDVLFTSGSVSGFRIKNFDDPSYYRSSLVCNMVVPCHFLHLLCAVRDLSTWIMHLVDECQGFQDRQSCVSWITYHLCVLPGLHSALQRCVAFVQLLSWLFPVMCKDISWTSLPGSSCSWGRHDGFMNCVLQAGIPFQGHLLCPTCKLVSVVLSCFFQVCLG